ncbi:unnamed protein product [Cylicocyclus nassatus]|uniref:Uncharacterized protein n=1 Tax=Cylicocyclus nassatus TaxID=53992 RepID=A0AA36M3V7_CYLNA|nr:unnamed protein product [Cylicocyclus nassatus]
MRIAVIICTSLCFCETEARVVNNTEFVELLVPVYCNATLLPSVDVDVQRVQAGCDITLRFPGRSKSKMWLRAVVEGQGSEQTVSQEAFQDCGYEVKKLRQIYHKMCYGFASIYFTRKLRRFATIKSPGVLELRNLTMEDSGIYQARSGRSYNEFTLQIEKPHFKLKVMNVNVTGN